MPASAMNRGLPAAAALAAAPTGNPVSAEEGALFAALLGVEQDGGQQAPGQSQPGGETELSAAPAAVELDNPFAGPGVLVERTAPVASATPVVGTASGAWPPVVGDVEAWTSEAGVDEAWSPLPDGATVAGVEAAPTPLQQRVATSAQQLAAAPLPPAPAPRLAPAAPLQAPTRFIPTPTPTPPVPTQLTSRTSSEAPRPLESEAPRPSQAQPLPARDLLHRMVEGAPEPAQARPEMEPLLPAPEAAARPAAPSASATPDATPEPLLDARPQGPEAGQPAGERPALPSEPEPLAGSVRLKGIRAARVIVPMEDGTTVRARVDVVDETVDVSLRGSRETGLVADQRVGELREALAERGLQLGEFEYTADPGEREARSGRERGDGEARSGDHRDADGAHRDGQPEQDRPTRGPYANIDEEGRGALLNRRL